MLANLGKDGAPRPVTTKINQETPVNIIGTTRLRVSYFMKLHYYNGELKVHSTLLSVVLSD